MRTKVHYVFLKEISICVKFIFKYGFREVHYQPFLDFQGFQLKLLYRLYWSEAAAEFQKYKSSFQTLQRRYCVNFFIFYFRAVTTR